MGINCLVRTIKKWQVKTPFASVQQSWRNKKGTVRVKPKIKESKDALNLRLSQAIG